MKLLDSTSIQQFLIFNHYFLFEYTLICLLIQMKKNKTVLIIKRKYFKINLIIFCIKILSGNYDVGEN